MAVPWPRSSERRGFGAGGVDEGDDRDAELLGVLHEALGFAVALGAAIPKL